MFLSKTKSAEQSSSLGMAYQQNPVSWQNYDFSRALPNQENIDSLSSGVDGPVSVPPGSDIKSLPLS
jgi:hypothetical protein